MPTENEIEMLRAARTAGITSREEMANFMAQMGHESGGFTRLEEGFRYTRGIDQIPVASARREGNEALETARQQALDGNPQELGRLMYGGRMGNDDVGDGYLYRGRGYTQLTGENNYRDAGTALNLDLVNNPDLASNRDNAQRIAVWYWQERVPEADRDDVSRATRGINGGENGLADRLNRYDAWHAVLTPEFLTELDAGRVQAGTRVAPATGQTPMADGALRRMENGAEVGQLQQNLHTLGIRTDSGREVVIDNDFGPGTEQAVRRFQQQQGLPVTGRADPSTLQAVDRAIEQQRQQNGTPATGTPEGGTVPGQSPPTGQRQGALPLDDPSHPNHAMYAQLSGVVNERDAALGRSPDQLSAQLSGGLTLAARSRGLEDVGFAKFSEDGSRVYMTDARDPSAPWARTAVADVGQAVNRPLPESSEQVAELNRTLVRQQDPAQPTQQQGMQQDPAVIQGPRLV